MMLTDSLTREDTESTSLAVTDDSDRHQSVAEVKQENLPVAKQEPDDVCCVLSCLLSASESNLLILN